MIVVFRRIKAAAGRVTGTEWLLVAVEGLLVFVGILAAFQLQEWAEDRREGRALDRLMDRLFEEAQLLVVDLNNHVVSFDQITKDADERAIMISEGQCPPAEAWRNLRFVEFYPAVTPPTAVYDEMIATVGQSAIPDYDVRFALTKARSSLDFLSAQNEHFRRSVELIADDDDRLSITYRRLEEDTTDIGDGSDAIAMTYDREALCADNAFRKRLMHVTRNQRRMQQYRVAAAEDAAYMCRALGSMIGRKCFDPIMADLLGEERATHLAKRAEELEAAYDNY